MLAQLAAPMQYTEQAVQSVTRLVSGQTIDAFYSRVSMLLLLAFTIALLPTHEHTKIINELLMEKESEVRESLRMLGVSSSCIFGSWYLMYGIVSMLLCLIFAVPATKIFVKLNALLLFVFLWLWCMAFVSLALCVQFFLRQSRTGGIVGILFMFAQWLAWSWA